MFLPADLEIQKLPKDVINLSSRVSCSCWGATKCLETLCSTNSILGSLTSDSLHFCHWGAGVHQQLPHSCRYFSISLNPTGCTRLEVMLFPRALPKDASFAFCRKPHVLAVIFFLNRHINVSSPGQHFPCWLGCWLILKMSVGSKNRT